MVPPSRFERLTFPLGGGRSIQLSYGGAGFSVLLPVLRMLANTTDDIGGRCIFARIARTASAYLGKIRAQLTSDGRIRRL